MKILKGHHDLSRIKLHSPATERPIVFQQGEKFTTVDKLLHQVVVSFGLESKQQRHDERVVEFGGMLALGYRMC